jgi:3-oxoacyl-[acyl-carrier protein] reductase
MQLAGKVVLVTGALQGIGTAMARKFAAAGADVAINWLDGEGGAQRVADEVRACGRRAISIQADVSRKYDNRKPALADKPDGLPRRASPLRSASPSDP